MLNANSDATIDTGYVNTSRANNYIANLEALTSHHARISNLILSYLFSSCRSFSFSYLFVLVSHTNAQLFSNLTLHIYMSSFAYISRLFYVGNPEKNYVSSLYTGIPNKTMPLSVLEGFYKAVVIIAHIYVTFSV